MSIRINRSVSHMPHLDVDNGTVRASLHYSNLSQRLFAHGWYEKVAEPEELVRIGLCKSSATNKTGLTPSGQRRSGGRVYIHEKTRTAIANDERYQTAIARVLDPKATLPDFSFPAPPALPAPPPPPRRRKKAKEVSQEEAVQLFLKMPANEACDVLVRGYAVLFGKRLTPKQMNDTAKGMTLVDMANCARVGIQQRASDDGRAS